ncbi:MFS transporter [Micromonospora sp. C51]|uniref:MFS transporter n=1 Tax=Micromonospora sp. C51 TaxID=2824879 RepID=UPI001FFCE576|nr:MFS transporter [Micromonospora sp. C51]
MPDAAPDSAAWRRTTAVSGLGALTVATFCFVVSENLPAGLLTLMATDLDTSLSAIGLLVTGYGLTVAAVAVPLTRAARRVPRRRLLSLLLAVFVLASLTAALAPGMELLLVSRIASALAHAVFWSVAVVTAAGLFPPRLRGRVVSVVFGASSVATVLGVPAGAWLGEWAGWRAAFLTLTGLGLVALVTVAMLLPTTAPEDGHAARAATPDARRYAVLLAATALAVAGLSVATTYTVPFLLEVSQFSGGAIGPLLFVRGVAGVVAVAGCGALLQRWPGPALVVPTGLLALSLFGFHTLGAYRPAVIGLLALSGASMFVMIAALANRVLDVAPGRTDIASAGLSAVFNASVAVGALLGAVLLPAFGVRSTVLAAAALVAAAVAVLSREPGIMTGVGALGNPRTDHEVAKGRS